MMVWLWVASGGAIGSVARYGVSIAALRLWGVTFPWGTLLINVVGSFIIGFFGRLTIPGGPFPASPGLRTFVMIGFCGGFTTFSSFSLQTLDLLQAGEVARSGLYILLSVALCLLFVWLGVLAGLLLAPLRGAEW